MSNRFSKRRANAPTIASLAPVLVGSAAEKALEMLEREQAAERLYYYPRLGREDEWNIWLEDCAGQPVPVPVGGRRVTLHEWALAVYPVLLEQKKDEAPEDRQGKGRSARRTTVGGRMVGLFSGVLRHMGLLTLPLVISLVGCDLGPTSSGNSGWRDTPQPVVTHRGHITAMFCNDDSVQYPPELFQAANAFMAKTLDAALRPDQDGLDLYVTYLSSPFQSTPLVVQIPAIGPNPTPPALTPTPHPTGTPDVYQQGAEQAKVNAANDAATKQYQQQLAAYQALLSDARGKLHTQLDALTGLNPTRSNTRASVWGCISLASHRFNNVPGEKWIVISSGLGNSNDVNAGQWYRMDGIHVRVLYMACQNAPECKSTENTWARIFHATGAADALFYDSGESQTLGPLWP